MIVGGLLYKKNATETPSQRDFFISSVSLHLRGKVIDARTTRDEQQPGRRSPSACPN